MTREWRDLQGYFRFARGLRSFLASPLSLDACRTRVAAGVANRQARLLRNLEFAVFGNPTSPYLKLFRNCGCEFGDVRSRIEQDGVDSTLAQLRDQGVYVIWEEFKGRTACRRGSFTAEFSEDDFDNPLVHEHYGVTSGGSSGRSVRMRIDLDNLAESAPDWAVWFEAQGWLGRPLIFWTATHTGMANRYLKCAKFGARYRDWFATTPMASSRDRVRGAMIHGLARLFGGFSPARPAPVDSPELIGDPLLERLSRGERPIVNTAPSSAARLSDWALSRGRSLEGLAFLLGAEPVTAERRQAMESAGAQAVVSYGTSEGGWIGAEFPGSVGVDEVQIFADAYALIPNGPDDGESHPLLFTSLRRANPKVLLNADIGDAARLGPHASQPAQALGFGQSIRDVRSYRKITAWGATLAVADLYPVLERALPERLGGGIEDYQLVENLNAQGSAQLVLLVRPSATQADDAKIRQAFFEEIGRRASYYQFMARVLDDAGSLRVERREPMVTKGQKYLAVLPQRTG